MQSNVPKFASFKPAAAPTTEVVSQRHKSKVESSHSTSKEHRHDHQRRNRGEEISLDADVFLGARSREETKTPRDHKYAHGYEDELFKVDRQGDQDNVRYGTNSKWHVPSYREPYENTLLGADRTRSGRATGNILARLSREDRARLMKDGRHVASSTLATIDTVLDLRRDYLPLAATRKRKRGSASSSILGLAHRRSQAADNTNSSGSSGNEGDDGPQSDDYVDKEEKPNSGDVAIRTRLTRLQEGIKVRPSNVEAWLAYVDFQPEWVAQGFVTETNQSSKDNSDVICRLQLAIINDALKAIGPDHSERDMLMLRKLDIGKHARTWSREKLEKEWEDAVAQSRDSAKILIGYIGYRQSTLETFQWENVRDLFVELFQALPKTRSHSNGFKDTAARLHLECTLQLTSFFMASGFTELAIAVWQVLFELCGSRDLLLKVDPMTMGARWNSGIIKYGEAGMQSVKSNARLVDNSRQDEDVFDIWAREEVARSSLAVTPARTTDSFDDHDDEDDDPFRIVLYSDIQAFVETWPFYQEASILSAFLHFCGLPASFENSEMCFPVEAYSDILMSHDYKCPAPGLVLPGKSWLAYTDTMFAIDDEVLYSFKDVPREGVLARLAANVLEGLTKQSIKAAPQFGDMSEYFLALTCHLDPKAARKIAKTLLEGGQSSCIRLYHSLALIEARQKGREAADRVFVLALKMGSHYVEEQLAEGLCLWNSWVREAMLANDVGLALRRIASIGLENPPLDLVLPDKPSQSQILRARDHLRRLRDQALSRGEPKVAVRATQLLVTLTHLTTLDISATAAGFASHLIYFERYVATSSPIFTLLHQHLAVLLYTHVSKRIAPYSPSELAAALLPSVGALPANGLILNIYAALFSHGNRLDDRVRSAVRQVLHIDQQYNTATFQTAEASSGASPRREDETGQSLIPHLFAIQTELSRAPGLGSTSVSIRTAFERATASPEGAHSERIWALYLDYEASLVPAVSKLTGWDKSKRQHARDFAALMAAQEKVKSIFYRGLSALPWNKAWAMRAFGVEGLRQALSTAEKKAVVEGMEDRGLRLRSDRLIDGPD